MATAEHVEHGSKFTKFGLSKCRGCFRGGGPRDEGGYSISEQSPLDVTVESVSLDVLSSSEATKPFLRIPLKKLCDHIL